LQVSLTGVTGARASVQGRVQGLLKELKEVTFAFPFFQFFWILIVRLACVINSPGLKKFVHFIIHDLHGGQAVVIFLRQILLFL